MDEQAKPMLHFPRWQNMLAHTRGSAPAAEIMAHTQTRYAELRTRSPAVAKRAQRAQLERMILPGLALYQVLREENANQANVFAEMEALFAASFAPMRNAIFIFRRVPAPFTALRLALHLQLRGERPEDWAMVEDSTRCFAFDVRRCFIHDTLSAYGAPELTQLYCKMDDLLNERLPRSIKWARTTTIGRGSARCDFRWERVR
jgi:hypothetical protein